jgi:hypothetical protein
LLRLCGRAKRKEQSAKRKTKTKEVLSNAFFRGAVADD